MKDKTYIDDFESVEDIKHLTIEEIKKIEGLEEEVQSIENLSKFIDNCEKIPDLVEKYNWFIIPSIQPRILNQVLKLYDSQDSVDNILVNYYKKNLKNLKNKICQKFVDRKNIIEEAYNAHLNQHYYSSIVLILTQIDGISKIEKEKNFFQKSQWKTVSLANDIKFKLAYQFLSSFFNFEEKQAPIRISENERPKDFKHLNRHQVLHGETLDYNTEINSLKAYALLFSLTENLEWLKNNEDTLANQKL